MTTSLASLHECRESVLSEARRLLERSTEQQGIDLTNVSLDVLFDSLVTEEPESAIPGLTSAIQHFNIPQEHACLVFSALRRALAGHLRGRHADLGLIESIEDIFDGAAFLLVREATAEARRIIAHHDWAFARLPAMVHSIDGEGKLVAVNDRWLQALGYTRDEVLERRSSEFLTPESARYAREVVLPQYFKSGRCDNVLYQFVRKDGTIIDIMLSAVADTDLQGRRISQAVLIDVTEQLAAERTAQKVAIQDELIRNQRERLLAVSTPLVPLGDGILLMPLVGDIERTRAEKIMAVLLDGVVTHSAEVAILDVTGVPSMDADVAEGLLGATKAVGLLGAHVILTGIGPSAARTLVELGVNLEGMTTKSTLRDGLITARKRIARKN